MHGPGRQKDIREIMPLKYFSTRGGDERLSFEEVRARISPISSQPSARRPLLEGREEGISRLQRAEGLQASESCGEEEQLTCRGDRHVDTTIPFHAQLARPPHVHIVMPDTHTRRRTRSGG